MWVADVDVALDLAKPDSLMRIADVQIPLLNGLLHVFTFPLLLQTESYCANGTHRVPARGCLHNKLGITQKTSRGLGKQITNDAD